MQGMKMRKKKFYKILKIQNVEELTFNDLRDTTLAPGKRRLLKLESIDHKKTVSTLDMLLAKKRAADRKVWLEKKGYLVELNKS